MPLPASFPSFADATTFSPLAVKLVFANLLIRPLLGAALGGAQASVDTIDAVVTYFVRAYQPSIGVVHIRVQFHQILASPAMFP